MCDLPLDEIPKCITFLSEADLDQLLKSLADPPEFNEKFKEALLAYQKAKEGKNG